MDRNSEDTRRDIILQAAYTVFASYGFRRATMSDIANAAGLSRPALYQHFRNKADIFRAYVALMKGSTLKAIDAAFARDDAFPEKLASALDGAFLAPHRLISASPHGEELLGVNNEIAGDLFLDWMDGAETAFRAVFNAEQEAGRLDFSGSGLDPAGLAALVIEAMEGIKMRMTSLDAAERSVENLVRLVAAAVGR